MSQRREVDQTEALQQYTLPGVRETGDELGRGSYAAVYTVEYKGLTCAAKIFHPTLYQQEYAIRRFQEECAILSRLRHPNIVQFLGVYHQPGSMLPALVMECLPMTLAQCLDQYGVLPNEMGYSILKDVALALSYLHKHDPPIIHRDLSANNVLLTRGMTAKISDLGVAKMLDLNPTQMSTMTNGPGTLCYMPPEAIDENAHYNRTIDAFSYGVLMVHLFSGQWPFPTKAAAIVDPQDDSRMIPQSETDRRQEKLDAIGRDHPLMSLILRCLHNSPARRPEAVEILTQVSRVAAQFPPSSQNKVELLRQVTSLKADTERLQREHEAEISSMRADAERLQQEHQAEIRSQRESSSAEHESTRQTLQAEIRSAQTHQREAGKAVEESQRKLEDAERCHSMEVQQLNLRLADTRDTLSSRVGEVEAELRAAQQLISPKKSALSDRDKEVAKLTGQMAELRQEMVDQLTERKKNFDQRLLAKDQLLIEMQIEFDQQLVEKQKAFDEQLVERQKAFDQQLLAKEKMFKQKLLAKDQLLAEKDQKERELDQTLLARDQIVLEKNQLLFEKDQQLQKLREMEVEIDVVLPAIQADFYSKESLVASKDSIIGGLQEQLDHLRKSHTAQVIEEKESEIRSLNTRISSLNTRISSLNTHWEHLNTTYLELSPFPSGAELKWKKCRDMPRGMLWARTVLIRGKVYVGGGSTRDDDYLIRQYSITDDKWSTLPPAPVHAFGMGELNGQLVVVGGGTRQDVVTRKVHTFDSSSQKWKESIPPMPTAHYNAAVFSQPSCLTVVGGRDQHQKDLSNIEIFIPQTSQWHNASPAPFPLSRMTTTVIHNKCFLAECTDSAIVYQLCVSVHLATTTTGSSVTTQVTTEWKALPELPYECFALGSLNGCLLAVGGGWHNPISTVQCYSPITNTWERVGDLPDQRCVCSTVLLPTTGELLVVGGLDGPRSRTTKVWRAAITI